MSREYRLLCKRLARNSRSAAFDVCVNRATTSSWLGFACLRSVLADSLSSSLAWGTVGHCWCSFPSQSGPLNQRESAESDDGGTPQLGMSAGFSSPGVHRHWLAGTLRWVASTRLSTNCFHVKGSF